MKDIHAQLDKVRSDAAECLLLSSLATDGKREVFTRMAEHLNALAFELEKTIATTRASESDQEENAAPKIPSEHPKQPARPRLNLPWLLVVALGAISVVSVWAISPAERYWSFLQPKYEAPSRLQDNTNKASAALVSGEQSELKTLTEQVTALARRLDDFDKRLDYLKTARTQTAEPLNTGSTGAEAKPATSATPRTEDTSPPPAVEKPVSTVDNRTAEKPTSLKPWDAFGPPGCARFRSYDPKSETYMTLDGRRRPCR